MADKLDTIDLRIARIAERQHGIVTTRQLEMAGIHRSTVAERAARGSLHRLYRGVYAVGHKGLGLTGQWMAAVLVCGEDAVLSHMSAAALWKLLRPEDGPIDVSIPTSAGRARHRGVRIHRCKSLAEGSVSSLSGGLGQTRHAAPLVTVRHGIPVTSVARTIDDLRRTAPPHLVRRAQRQAELARYALSPRTVRRGTRSDLEDEFLAFLRRHRLPLPEVNVKLGRYEVDFLWRRERLVVETDFYDYHRGSVSFEDDHQRDLELRRQGYTVHRYTGAQLDSHPAEIAGELGEILS